MRQRISRSMVLIGALALMTVAACQNSGTDQAPLQSGSEDERSAPQGAHSQGAPSQPGAPGGQGAAGQ
jgi:hypothetical protein